MHEKKTCINCGHMLVCRDGVWLCENCNPDSGVYAQPFFEPSDSDEYVFIECPGATLYEPGTRKVTAGVEFLDEDDPLKGYRIIKEPVFAPTHARRRRIRREALGKIRRCQGCQDYTIRMLRPEGRDFFIPSHKHPGRKKLKAVTHRNYL